MVRGAATLPNGSGKVCSSLLVGSCLDMPFQDTEIYVYFFLLLGSSLFFYFRYCRKEVCLFGRGGDFCV
jgi:hypothetical protein